MGNKCFSEEQLAMAFLPQQPFPSSNYPPNFSPQFDARHSPNFQPQQDDDTNNNNRPPIASVTIPPFASLPAPPDCLDHHHHLHRKSPSSLSSSRRRSYSSPASSFRRPLPEVSNLSIIEAANHSNNSSFSRRSTQIQLSPRHTKNILLGNELVLDSQCNSKRRFDDPAFNQQQPSLSPHRVIDYSSSPSSSFSRISHPQPQQQQRPLSPSMSSRPPPRSLNCSPMHYRFEQDEEQSDFPQALPPPAEAYYFSAPFEYSPTHLLPGEEELILMDDEQVQYEQQMQQPHQQDFNPLFVGEFTNLSNCLPLEFCEQPSYSADITDTYDDFDQQNEFRRRQLQYAADCYYQDAWKEQQQLEHQQQLEQQQQFQQQQHQYILAQQEQHRRQSPRYYLQHPNPEEFQPQQLQLQYQQQQYQQQQHYPPSPVATTGFVQPPKSQIISNQFSTPDSRHSPNSSSYLSPGGSSKRLLLGSSSPSRYSANARNRNCVPPPAAPQPLPPPPAPSPSPCPQLVPDFEVIGMKRSQEGVSQALSVQSLPPSDFSSWRDGSYCSPSLPNSLPTSRRGSTQVGCNGENIAALPPSAPLTPTLLAALMRTGGVPLASSNDNSPQPAQVSFEIRVTAAEAAEAAAEAVASRVPRRTIRFDPSIPDSNLTKIQNRRGRSDTAMSTVSLTGHIDFSDFDYDETAEDDDISVTQVQLNMG